MAREHAIGSIDQIPKGEGRNFLVAGLRIAVFHTHVGEVYATQAECPHAGGPLADGLVGGATVVCPLHERIYDLRTGTGLGNEFCLTVYPARMAPDGIIILTLD